MKRVRFAFVTIFFLASFLTTSALACSWAAYTAGTASIVARTMDWYSDDNAVVRGHGRGVEVKAADSPNALTYKSKYASIKVHSFASGIVAEALNERGLQCSILFLEGSELPTPTPTSKDVGITHIVGYVVDNFASVQEVVGALSQVNIAPASPAGVTIHDKPLDYAPERAPMHFAVADASGDRLIVELWQGQTKLYHGSQHDTLSNEPNYEVHTALDEAGYQANGTNMPIDRRARARQMLADMRTRKVEDHARAFLAMRGVLATVHAGTEQIDPTENEVYPTIWSALADQNAKTYHIWHYAAWDTAYYDFSMFPNDKPEVVDLKPGTPPTLKK